MRYQPHTQVEIDEMLADIGATSVDDLYSSVPNHLLLKRYIEGLPKGQPEMAVERDMQLWAQTNHCTSDGPFFLGAGYYKHHIPATVDYIIQRGEFLTSYTPYQPEVAQGTLMAIFEFQSYIARLTGQQVANASMYDGATSLAEAVLMANRLHKNSRTGVCIAETLHPHYKETLETYLTHTSLKLDAHVSQNTACVVVPYPEIVALGLLQPPQQADIVVGEAQSIGIPLSYGGPALGFFACKQDYLRQLPGRIVGETTDVDGRRSFVLTLNTREQHIRRDKATSNICTNEGLCALAFTVHASLLGEQGFKKLAQLNHAKAQQLAKIYANVDGFKVLNTTYFNEFVVQTPQKADKIATHLQQSGIIAGYPISDHKLLVCATETNTAHDFEQLSQALKSLPQL